nr:unnamed protein product [Spirometra erinaceieuropaei]
MYQTDSRFQWKYFKTGVLTVEASVRYDRVSLCIYDLTAGKRVWQQNLFREMTYLDSSPQFHCFYGECSAVGLSFADPIEASSVGNAVHFYLRDRRTSTLNRLTLKSVGGKAKSVLKRTKSKLRSPKKPAVTHIENGNACSKRGEEDDEDKEGEEDEEEEEEEEERERMKEDSSHLPEAPTGQCMKQCGFTTPVPSPAFGLIDPTAAAGPGGGRGRSAVTNAINKIQDSQTAYSSVSQHEYMSPNTARAPPSSTRPPLPSVSSTPRAPPPPAPPAPPPPPGPHSGEGIPSPDPGNGGGGGGGGFLNDIRNFNKNKLKTTTVTPSRQPSFSSPGGVTVDSLGDALAKLLESRRMHLESDTDSDFE